MTTDWQVFDLPKPISTNELFRNGKGGRYKTARYVTWLRGAGWMIKAHTPKIRQLREPCEAHIYVTSKWRGDLDNALKGLLDSMQEFGVVLNDKLITKITIERAEIEGCRVAIRPFDKAEAA